MKKKNYYKTFSATHDIVAGLNFFGWKKIFDESDLEATRKYGYLHILRKDEVEPQFNKIETS
ncbi:hypothetical protein IM40_00540 [Candidatus Paracaedimonas acanthamoebae]|nr:hypothetical protein IM40_00540 [Candidatus Paracaedimonas acanthamoebae]